MSSVSGIHHVTAIASDPQRNLDFYAGVLGLRLVKRTVNFDDPRTYHFYFGDETGRPGSLLTFFPWPGARRGRAGAGQVAVTSFAVLPGAIGFWVERLVRHGVPFEGPATRRLAEAGTEQVIGFRDGDGLMLEIVGHPGAEAHRAWGGAAGLPVEHALRGFHAVSLWVADHAGTGRLLTDTLGLRLVGEDGETRRYAAGDQGGTGRVDVRAVGGFPRGAEGAGTVHHVAWRVSDDASQAALREAVIAGGRRPTPVIDRQYFRSVYFREPGGVLFELATDGPGFAIDEPVEHLGERLTLPPQYEQSRSAIEAALPAVHVPNASPAAASDPGEPGVERMEPQDLGFIHRYQPPAAPSAPEARVTLLLLHGTGGNEDDLPPLGRMLLPGAGLLSPRGKVLEHGMPRFFRRLAEGVFDQEDLARRTTELAGFIEGAASAYRLDRNGIVAVGFSNGANIAASVLLRVPGLLRAAVLLSPMLPFEPGTHTDLTGTSVFIGAGRADSIALPDQVERLAEILRERGATVTVQWDPGGHTISPALVTAARQWIEAWTSVT
jgi:predicted esterase/catechol 2,3-dioxygenase-like lactoylglutathione lyase family enzyme